MQTTPLAFGTNLESFGIMKEAGKTPLSGITEGVNKQRQTFTKQSKKVGIQPQ